MVLFRSLGTIIHATIFRQTSIGICFVSLNYAHTNRWTCVYLY